MTLEQRTAVWKAVAAVLHLGCLHAHHALATSPNSAGTDSTALDDTAADDEARGPPEPLVHAARLLGCSAEALWRALAGSGGRGTRGSAVAVPGSLLVARTDALARHICSKAFEWMGELLNGSLAGTLARRASSAGAASPRAENLDLSQLTYLAVLESPPPASPLDGEGGATGGAGWWGAAAGAARECDLDGLLQMCAPAAFNSLSRIPTVAVADPG